MDYNNNVLSGYAGWSQPGGVMYRYNKQLKRIKPTHVFYFIILIALWWAILQLITLRGITITGLQ